jgi:hypothetical protein
MLVNVVYPLHHPLVLLKSFNYALPQIVYSTVLSWYWKLTMQVAQRAEKGNDASNKLECVYLIFADKGSYVTFRHRTMYCRTLSDAAWRVSSASSDVDLIDRTGKR